MRTIPSPDVILSTWPARTIAHTIEPNGSQLATPTTGPAELTETEWREYSQVVSSQSYRQSERITR
jgi:hypothetical protein